MAARTRDPDYGVGRLQEAVRINNETTEIGSTVVNQLHNQTRQIEDADETVQEVSRTANQAKVVVREMKNRLWREKRNQYIIMILLLGTNIAVTYYFIGVKKC